MKTLLLASTTVAVLAAANLVPAMAQAAKRSLIRQQVEMGVAVRMACLEILIRDLGNGPPPT
jgi:hypothetical protein